MPDAPAPASTAAPAPAAAPAGPSGPVPFKAAPPAQVTPPPVKKAPPGPSAYDELDRIMAEEEPKKPAAKKEGKAVPPTKGQSQSSAKAADSPLKDGPTGEEAAETPEGSTTPDAPPKDAAVASDKTPLNAPELRVAYAALKKKHAALEAEHTKAKVAPAEDPEKPRLVAELTSAQKRLEALETELKYTNYERSQEYQDTYEKPFIAAYQAGRQKASSLAVTQEDGTTRRGTSADFDAVMSIADDSKATALANEMFGNGAGVVLYHRERVQEFNRARQDAVEEFRKTGAEREKSRSAKFQEMQQQRQHRLQAMANTFKSKVTEGVDKYPTFFKPEEGDEDGNALLEKGMAWADSAFDIGRDTPPDEIAAMHAAVRNKAGAFDRMVHREKKHKARIAELEKELEAFKASEPGADGGKREAPTKPQTWEQEIEGLASKS